MLLAKTEPIIDLLRPSMFRYTNEMFPPGRIESWKAYKSINIDEMTTVQKVEKII